MTVVFDMVASKFIEDDAEDKTQVSTCNTCLDQPDVALALQPVVPDAAQPRGTSPQLPADLAYRYFFTE